MSISNGTKINQLLSSMDAHGVLLSDWMKAQGYSPQLQKRYRDSGWLVSLSKGVMYRTGNSLTAFSTLASYNKQSGAKLRIAAHSALEYAGFNHYVPMGKPTLCIAVPSKAKRPMWLMEDVFDMSIKMFSTDVLKEEEVRVVESANGTLYVSSPEQAFLECLLQAPQTYNYMDLYYIMEQLVTLRSDVVQRLLEGCDNYRVKRMFLYMAEKAGHYWYDELCLDKISLGPSKYHLTEKGEGVLINKYNMTVPKELENYEDFR